MAKRLLALTCILAFAVTGIGVRADASIDHVEPLGPPPGGGPINEVVVDFGPFDLTALGTGATSEDVGEGAIPRPPGAYGLKYVLFDIVDADGNSFGKHDIHMHHFVAASVNEPDPLCDRTFSGIPVRPVFGTGAERTPIAFPGPYVSMVEDNDVWGATWHLMNLTDAAETVYIRYRLGIQEGATATNSRVVTPYFLDVTAGAEGPADSRSCGAANYQVPGDGGPDSHTIRSNSWAIERAGILVGAGSHLHAGGLTGVLTDEDGTEICDSPAIYSDGGPHEHSAPLPDAVGSGASHLGSIDRIQPCLLHHQVPAGERITLDAHYDNSHSYRDVMGIMMLYIWHGAQVAPPTTTASTTTTTVLGETTTTLPANPAAPITTTPRYTG